MNYIFSDIGNTSIGFFYVDPSGRKVLKKAFAGTDLSRELKTMLAELSNDRVTIYVSSVNSENCKSLVNALRDYSGRVYVQEIESYMVKDKVDALGYCVPNLDILGIDMLFDVLGSEPSTIVADYGTASKLMPVNKDKVFLGGMVGPGLGLLNRSLFKSTEKLGNYLVSLPPDYVNYSTEGAVTSASTFGEAFKVHAFYEKCCKDLKEDMKLVLTGGDGELILKAMERLGYRDGTYDPYVVYRGMSKALGIYGEELLEKK